MQIRCFSLPGQFGEITVYTVSRKLILMQKLRYTFFSLFSSEVEAKLTQSVDDLSYFLTRFQSSVGHLVDHLQAAKIFFFSTFEICRKLFSFTCNLTHP